MAERRRPGRRSRRPRLAERADRHDLYQRSVQTPEADLEFFQRVFRRRRRRLPWSLREDFCGTAYLSTEWVKGHQRRTALGIDLDGDTLAWGRRHNLAPAGPAVARRVRLVEADVAMVTRPRVDLACALNFSFCVFKRRQDLRRYFEAVHQGLARDGMLVLELYGGTEAIVAIEEDRPVDDFTVVWEQESYNPITHDTRCHLHFELADGSRLERAFTYDWRLWSIPEVRELLAEAGFARSRVYWEEVDQDGEGTGERYPTDEEENQEAWLVYIVGEK